MSFDQPIMLAALAAVPLLIGLRLVARRRRRTYAVRHPATAVAAGVAGLAPAWRRRVPAALSLLAAAALALALARPEMEVEVPVEKASVVLVTDESGSMMASDVQPSRLDAARSAAGDFLDAVPDELLVGFVGYASAVRSQLEPTTDHDRVAAAIGALRADGGTATGDALTAALDRLQARRAKDGTIAPAAIVLLSDGKTTEGSDPLEAAARAKRLKVPVYTVALGTGAGTVTGPMGEPIAVPPDPETLRRIARTSGGEAYAVSDAGALEQVYEDLGSRIGTTTETREITTAFAAGGLLLLAGGLGTGLRTRGRLV